VQSAVSICTVLDLLGLALTDPILFYEGGCCRLGVGMVSRQSLVQILARRSYGRRKGDGDIHGKVISYCCYYILSIAR
jgi:hypothetical protein